MSAIRDAIEPLFHENFARHGEIGASVSIWVDGREELSLHSGFANRLKSAAWSEQTLCLIWSCTKAIGAITLLHALYHKRISVGTRVAEIWPEFAQNGKERITIRQLLAHQAGLPVLDPPIPDAFDVPGVMDALAAQPPLWEPGVQHGYHARTFGYLLDGVLWNILPGETIGTWWRKAFADPLELDIWIGLPEELHWRAAQMLPATGKRFATPESDRFYADLARPGSLTQRAMTSPSGLVSVHSMNSPEARSASLPSFSGIASANSLARFYGLLADPMQRSVFLPEEIFDALTERVSDGPDLILDMPTAFSAGSMLDPMDASGRKWRRHFGPAATAFGHPGAGGGHAFCDPENGVGFAYLMNQMELGVMPNPKALRMVDALYRALGVEGEFP